MDLPVVFLPGLMGSRLKNASNQAVFNPFGGLNASISIANIAGALNPAAGAIVTDPGLAVIDMNALRHETLLEPCDEPGSPAPDIRHFRAAVACMYGTALRGLKDRLGSSRDVSVCGYDWRSAQAGLLQLEHHVAATLANTGAPQVVLVAHSFGGLVARQSCMNGLEDKVRALFLLGSPTFGTPKAMQTLKTGLPFFGPQDLAASRIAEIATDFLIGAGAVNPWLGAQARSLLTGTLKQLWDASLGSMDHALGQLARDMPSLYELLPSAAYTKAAPDWLQWLTADAAGRTSPDFDAYSLYTKLWTGVSNRPGFPSNAGLVRDAVNLHAGLDTYTHPRTFVACCNDIPTVGKLVLETDPAALPPQRQLVPRVKSQDTPGDGTVTSRSANPIRLTGSNPFTKGTIEEVMEVSAVPHTALPSAPAILDWIAGVIARI